jgi:hypothetical protein
MVAPNARVLAIGSIVLSGHVSEVGERMKTECGRQVWSAILVDLLDQLNHTQLP